MPPIRRLFQVNILALAAIISLLSIGTLYILYAQFEESRQENRQAYLEQNLQKAVIEFEKGIEKYAVLVSGLRSYTLGLGRVPSAQDIQNFVIRHIELIEYGNSIIINYIDADHIFVFSVSEVDLTPNELVGVNLNDIRPPETVRRMEYLLQTDGLVSFPPINLYEGFVGFPIDFRLVLNDEVVGYMTPLIDIKNILDPVISADVNDEFTFRFSYGDDVTFDREQVDNGTKVHHSRIDTANSHLANDKYLTAEIECYNLPFSIGIAYRDEIATASILPFIRASFAVVLVLLLISSMLFHFFLQSRSRSAELKDSNEELVVINSFLKKFIYASSHDLKQPLVNINNFQGLLRRKYVNEFDTEGHKYFDIISSSIKHMHLILEDLLIYSKILRGGKEKETFDLSAVLEEIEKIYVSKKVRITYSPLSKITGNRSEIQRLFHNLISNAIKFNDKDIAEVQINCKDQKERLEISISDNGIGIAEEHRDIIFEEFQQVDKYKYGGTGLGLSICKEIVRNHGGTIRAEGNDFGGADFIFQLRTHD